MYRNILIVIAILICFFMFTNFQSCWEIEDQDIIDAMKELADAEHDYNNESCPHTYTGMLACLGSGNGAGWIPYIDAQLSSGVKSGYTFTLATGGSVNINSWWAWSSASRPISYPTDGVRSFYVDDTDVVRGSDIGGSMGTLEMPIVSAPGPIQACKTIVGAETDYNNNSNPHTYMGMLACLGSGNGAGGVPFIDNALSSGVRGGYTFSLVTGGSVNAGSWWAWSSTCRPIRYPWEGVHSFYVDQSGLVRGSDMGGDYGIIAMPHFPSADTPVDCCKQLKWGETDYNNNSNPHTYMGMLACLGSGNGAGGIPFIDNALSSGVKSGYTFTLATGGSVNAQSWWAWSSACQPVTYGADEILSYYIDQSGVIRGSDMGGDFGILGMPFFPLPGGSPGAACRELVGGETDYNNNSSPHTYIGILACLGSGNGAGGVPFIDATLSSGIKAGYTFTLATGGSVNAQSWWAWSSAAQPVTYGADGRWSFYIDQSGVLRGSDIGGDFGDFGLPVDYCH